MTEATTPPCSRYVAAAIDAELDRLRRSLAVARYRVHDARRCHWGWWPTAEGERCLAIRRLREQVRQAERELRRHIAEHRPLMAPTWVGNDHGRLCWHAFRGGRPIDLHYCQRPEGHDGNHANDLGAWTDAMVQDRRLHFSRHRRSSFG